MYMCLYNYFVLKKNLFEVNDYRLCDLLQVFELEKVIIFFVIEQGGILQWWFLGWGGWYGLFQSEVDISRRFSLEAVFLEVGELFIKIRKNNEDLGICMGIFV